MNIETKSIAKRSSFVSYVILTLKLLFSFPKVFVSAPKKDSRLMDHTYTKVLIKTKKTKNNISVSIWN